MTDSPSPIIVTDANVLINLLHVARLDLCARLPGLEFVVPDHVHEEITDSAQLSTPAAIAQLRLDDGIGVVAHGGAGSIGRRRAI